MTATGPRFGVNLMPNLWDGGPGQAGPELLARRRRLLGRMTDAGLDHVMIGDHVMFQGGLGNAHAKEAGRPDVDWRHGMTFWCAFGSARAQARVRVAAVMEGFYRLPFGSFERYVPQGTAAEVAEQVAPYIDAGCSTLNFIPFAGSDEEGIDAVAEVQQILVGSSR